MAKMKEIVIRRSVRLVGVAAAARRVGCSPAHLSQTLNGKRASRRLMERLAAAGVRVEA